jgi:hypothetical protein
MAKTAKKMAAAPANDATGAVRAPAPLVLVAEGALKEPTFCQ